MIATTRPPLLSQDAKRQGICRCLPSRAIQLVTSPPEISGNAQAATTGGSGMVNPKRTRTSSDASDAIPKSGGDDSVCYIVRRMLSQTRIPRSTRCD